ncbi:hypothetical protein ABIB87_008959 [Bradyrhizobium sp. JR18.2]
MDSSIAPSPAGKRGRNSSVILTDRMCEKRVAKRTKLYDRKCPGLYVSITTTRGGNLLVQVHRPGDRQATHRLAWRLQC